MYESDTCAKLAAAFVILDFCDQLLDQEKKVADIKVLVYNSSLYLVTLYEGQCVSYDPLGRAVCNT